MAKKKSIIESVFNIIKNHIDVNLFRDQDRFETLQWILLLMLIGYCLRKNKSRQLRFPRVFNP
jgi:hypothetical protein